MGHVNNGVQFFYYDLGRIHYLEKLQGSPIAWTDIDMVVVHTSCDFLHSIREQERIGVQSKITALGNKSVRMLQRIINCDTQEVKSTCVTVLSGFDRANDRSKPIDEGFKQRARDFEHDPLTPDKP